MNPYSYGEQMSNVKQDGSGNVSPEGEAFVLLMESARRDYLANGGKVSSSGSGGGSNGAGSTKAAGSRTSRTVVALVVAASLMMLA